MKITIERSQVSNKLEVEQLGQLSGHLHPGFIKHQPKSEESGIEQTHSSTRGTAEQALTCWSHRKYSRKVRSQVTNQLEMQQEGQMSGHLHPVVVESSAGK
jgi:hypothetical protein